MAQASQFSGQSVAGIIWLVLIVAIFYFLAIRPQQKRAKEHDALVAATKTGDKIVTVGGVHGTVKQVGGDSVTVEIAKGTSVVIDKDAIGRKQSSETPNKES